MTKAPKYQIAVLRPQGRLDLHGGTALELQIAGLISHSSKVCLIDLAQVEFIDSSGLAALVPGVIAARRHHCRLLFCNVQPSVLLIFELTRLDSVLEIFESQEDALKIANA